MSGLVEAATAILCSAERRLEIAAHNVANVSTPGFKRQISFAQLLAPAGLSDAEPEIGVQRNFAQGKLSETRNPLDLAISGAGFFQLRAGDRILYSRQGQFSLSADGQLVTPQGYVLQQQGGGDIVLEKAGVTIMQDGTIVDDGRPVARIDVFAASDSRALTPVGESCFSAGGVAMEAIAEPVIRQGLVESSNVELGGEMVSMMMAMRQSESGAKLMQTYDDLMGRALSSLGQSR